MAKWIALQCLTAFAVVSANIYWEITPNPYLAGFAGWGAAYGVTWLITEWSLRRAARRVRRISAGEQASRDDLRLPRVYRHPGDTLEIPPRARISDNRR